ncbi:polysaccharide deacetylase family protein [Candidatus Saccharibacteria bacterium]|nr:polysaccharide deacetylase family protein [Candidatus Saccharibacteria bacterium]
MKKLQVLLSILLSAVILATTAQATTIQPPKPVELTILMYHFVVENRGEHHISPDEFERDLAFLKKNGYNTIGISELTAFVYDSKPLPPKPVMLTFDDGYYNNYVNAFPLLKQYGMKAVISIIGDHTDIWSGNFYEDMQAGHTTWTQIREMLDSGLVEIGNHTYSMHFIKDGRKGCRRKEGEPLPDYQRLFARDVRKLQNRALEECGITPEVFAFPYHAVCDEAIQVLQILGFRAAFTGPGKSNTIAPGDTDCLFDLRRVNRSRLRSAEAILTAT